MASVITQFLKIDPVLPSPYNTASWVPLTDGATPFEREAEAQRVKAKVPDASGVVLAVDGYFYVMRVSSAVDGASLTRSKTAAK
jgi:hypothetical protein